MIGRTLVWMCLVFFAGGCATAPRPRPPEAADIPLNQICQKYDMDCRSDGVAQTVTMSYKGTKIQALVGSNIVLVGNAKIGLTGPLTRQKGMVVVPPDFERAVIGPVTSPLAGVPPALPKRIGKVVIDAGHGGKDPGAIGYSGTKEKEINLDIARRINEHLTRSGIDVIMTRSKDEFIELTARTAIATQVNVELFVSIHANANKRRHARGIEVYYIGALKKDDHAETQRRLNEKKLIGKLNIQGQSDDVKNIVLNMLYNHKVSATPAFADRVSRALAREMAERSRGSKPERFFVLRNTLVPAVLVEVGFMSNPQEEKQLKDPEYREKIAATISQSILEYLYATGI